jgi:glucose-6-phosphate 1-dehydrogenase
MNDKTTYVIFGASGDLSKRYLMPAVKNLQNMKKQNKKAEEGRNDFVGRRKRQSRPVRVALMPSGVGHAS